MASPIQNQNSAATLFASRMVAAGGAMAFTYYGYAAKTARQIGKAVPPINLETTVGGGFRTTPNVAFTVATQMTVQEFFQKIFSPKTAEPSFPVILASSGIAGIVCSPLLAGFNGQTMNQTFFESLKSTTWGQSVAISFREASFIASLKLITPLSAFTKEKWGDKKWVNYGTAFVSGSLGSIISHPADTILSLLQTGEKIRFSRLMRGVSSRTLATGVYVMIFDALDGR